MYKLQFFYIYKGKAISGFIWITQITRYLVSVHHWLLWWTFVNAERMKRWVASCLTCSGRFTHISFIPVSCMQVEHRTGSVRRSKTNILSLCHATTILKGRRETIQHITNKRQYKLSLYNVHYANRLQVANITVTTADMRPSTERPHYVHPVCLSVLCPRLTRQVALLSHRGRAMLLICQ